MIYLKMYFDEVEECFNLFFAINSDAHRKNHRIARRFPVFSSPATVVKTLREMADELERKFPNDP